MTVHELTVEQIVARPRGEVFAFFSRPENLARITPAAMRFEMVSDDRAMRTGLRLAYRLRPLLSIPTTWISEITRHDPPHSFVDMQVRGPYSRWEHTHTFEDVRVGDELGTRLYFGEPLRPVHPRRPCVHPAPPAQLNNFVASGLWPRKERSQWTSQ